MAGKVMREGAQQLGARGKLQRLQASLKSLNETIYEKQFGRNLRAERLGENHPAILDAEADIADWERDRDRVLREIERAKLLVETEQRMQMLPGLRQRQQLSAKMAARWDRSRTRERANPHKQRKSA